MIFGSDYLQFIVKDISYDKIFIFNKYFYKLWYQFNNNCIWIKIFF